MKYAHDVIDLLECYPTRSFRVGELLRYATKGRDLTDADREAARKAVRRVLDALVASGAVVVSMPARVSGMAAEYSVPRFRDICMTQAGQDAGQFSRVLAS